MPEVQPLVHLFAGGVGGTVGAVVTSPLDVVKTRLQSSCAHWNATPSRQFKCPNTGLPIDPTRKVSFITSRLQVNSYSTRSPTMQMPRLTLVQCLRYIYRTEGLVGWFRGLGPNLVGVAPSRAIYFSAYAKSKEFYSQSIHHGSSNSMVHILSAGTAGFICCTLTNPIWFLKTRLQLDEKKGANKLTVLRCIRNVYNKNGIKGFYRGLTASYMGISETALYFVIYEKLKERIIIHGRSMDMENDRSPMEFAEYTVASALSKAIACVTFYPHEVARTRMRQEGNVYKGVFQTLCKVAVEEGRGGLYRGLVAQLVRAIPNSAVMMCTYEIVVHILSPSSQKNEVTDNDDSF